MIHITSVGVNLVRSTLDGCIVVRSMRSSIIVLGCPVRPIPAGRILLATGAAQAEPYSCGPAYERPCPDPPELGPPPPGEAKCALKHPSYGIKYDLCLKRARNVAPIPEDAKRGRRRQ